MIQNVKFPRKVDPRHGPVARYRELARTRERGPGKSYRHPIVSNKDRAQAEYLARILGEKPR